MFWLLSKPASVISDGCCLSWRLTPLDVCLCRKRAKGGNEQGEDRGSLWLEPMQWMQELSNGDTQGKLYCPG